MNKKTIYKRHCMWYNKRHPHNLVDDLTTYIKYSLRDRILWLEKYCREDGLHITLMKFNKAVGSQNKSKQDLLSVLRKMYFSFEEVSLDFPNSPWNIWLDKNHKDCVAKSLKREVDYVTYKVACETLDSVKEAQKKYDSTIDEGIKLYVNLMEFIFDMSIDYGYGATKKARNRQLRKINSILTKVCAFGNDQEWYIYEGLVEFKKSKRYGHPCGLTADVWESYLDNMIFTFHEIIYYNENSCNYSAEEYKQKYNRGKELFGKYFLNLWD